MNKKLFILGLLGIFFSINLATANDETTNQDSTTTGNVVENKTGDIQPKQEQSKKDIILKAKITQNYKVSLKWNKIKSIDGEDVENYVILISTGAGNLSYPAGEGVKTVNVVVEKETTDNWDAKGTTYYKICAITQSEKTLCSNEVKIIMGPNGEPAYGTNQNQSGNRQFVPKPFSGDCLGGSGEQNCPHSMSGEFASGFEGKWKMGRPMMSGQNFSGNNGKQWGTGDLPKNQRTQRKSFLSQKTKQYLEQKLNAVSDDKKLEIYRKIIEKIEKKIKSLKENTEMKEAKRYTLIGALNEIKEIIKNKINNIENNNIDEGTIDGLFEDTGA